MKSFCVYYGIERSFHFLDTSGIIRSNKESGLCRMKMIPSNVLHCYFLFHPESPPIDGSGGFRASLPVRLNILKRYRFPYPVRISMHFQRILCMNYAGLFIYFLRVICYDVVTKGKRKPLDYFTTNQCSSLFSPPLFFPKVPWVMTDDPGHFWIFGEIRSSHNVSMMPWCGFLIL